MTQTSIPPLPDLTGPAGQYWTALNDGQLCYQQCRSCAHAQLPPREECSVCLAADLEMVPASGDAVLVSWIVYHRVYHPAFADQIPYNVGIVELAEGPRLTTNIVTARPERLYIGQQLRFRRGQRFGMAIAQFTPNAEMSQ